MKEEEDGGGRRRRGGGEEGRREGRDHGEKKNRSLTKLGESLPINLLFLIEGEEETDSAGLLPCIEDVSLTPIFFSLATLNPDKIFILVPIFFSTATETPLKYFILV
jgi:hypothetical protein